MDPVAGEAARFLTDNDVGAVFLVGAFKSAGDCLLYTSACMCRVSTQITGNSASAKAL